MTETAALSLRAGRPEDYAAFARLFLELVVPEPPPPPEVWEAELLPSSLFYDGPQGPVAYAVAEVMGELGYVVNLVVDASARRQGLGRRMMEAVAARFQARGCRSWGLTVKRDNTAALALYASLGMKPLREAATLRLSREHLEVLPPAPPGLRVVPAVEAEWEALTAAFRMTPGKLARFSLRIGHQLLRLERPGDADFAGLGVMDLRSGGVISPFFAATPGHARVLLEDAFQRTGASVLHAVVTDDAPLERLLRGAGAGVDMETLQMQGPL
ncbi:GNAT family N-acetyltransferase [Hyalangium rubrum]|uniref:GNAT family N-acetyltransferase n=1 Tax=Hyalangium rubrum TaxID=3103134 RepID=A0ABU5H190_9BACT|nr:GNAT family N-acetyltransferase [Hyalangium sp. s54d21]MDY7226899.1 GNAT family N-acetyltransferase [Hyalangium sp. s54d21]